MKQRELQTDWFADLIEDNLLEGGIVILGKSFKPETNIETGSPAHLLANILKERGHTFVHYDPLVDTYKISVDTPRTFFIGTKHDDFVNFNFPKGSIIIDPWRYIPDKKDCKVIQIGNRTNEL